MKELLALNGNWLAFFTPSWLQTPSYFMGTSIADATESWKGTATDAYCFVSYSMEPADAEAN